MFSSYFYITIQKFAFPKLRNKLETCSTVCRSENTYKTRCIAGKSAFVGENHLQKCVHQKICKKIIDKGKIHAKYNVMKMYFNMHTQRLAEWCRNAMEWAVWSKYRIGMENE